MGGPQSAAGGGSAIAVIDNVRSEGNNFGFKVEDNSNATIRNSIAANSAANGFFVNSAAAAATMTLENDLAANNGTNGVKANGANAVANMNKTVMRSNANGFNIGGGAKIFTTGDNTNWDAVNTGALQPVCCKQ